MKVKRLPAGFGENRHGQNGQRCRPGHLKKAQASQRAFRVVAGNQDDLQRVKYRAAHDKQISAVEIVDSLPRNREEIEAREGRENACPSQRTDLPLPYDRQKDGYKHNADSSNKSSFGRSRPGNPSRLKRIPPEHDGAKPQSEPEFPARQISEFRPVYPNHWESAERKPGRKVGKYGNIGEGVLDHNKGHAPKE